MWPTAFFVEHGLFGLVTAHAAAVQSSSRYDHRPESRVRDIRQHGSEGGGPEHNRAFPPLSGSTPLLTAARAHPTYVDRPLAGVPRKSNAL